MRTTGVRPTVPRMVSNFAIRPFYPRPRRQATGKARTNFERNSFLILAVVRVLRRARLLARGKDTTMRVRTSFGWLLVLLTGCGAADSAADPIENEEAVTAAARVNPVRSAPPVSVTNGIRYNGGPIMPGTVNIYYIWYGNWAGNTGPNILTE